MARAAGLALEPIEYAIERLRRNAAAAIGHLEHDLFAAAHRRQRHRLSRLREADRIGEQVEQHLADASPVGAQDADAVGRDDAQVDVRFAKAVLNALGRGLHRLDHVYLLGTQFQRARIDRGEVENVVDDREQRRRRGFDVAGIFDLLGVQRPGSAIGEQLREADDVGERRAKFVGDMVDEVVAQLLGADQGLVALGQRPLDIGARGRVEEGDQRRAVRQRKRRAVENKTVDAFDAALDRAAILGESDDRGAQPVPDRGVGEQRQAIARDFVDVRARGGARGIEAPELGEGGVDKLHPPVRAEHRDALFQRIECLALHAREGVELRSERETLCRVVIEIGDAALRVGAGDDAQRAPVGQVPDRLARLERGIGGEPFGLPAAKVRLLRQLALGAQTVENFAIGRRMLEKRGVERPDLEIGGIVENEPLGAVEDRDRGRELVEHPLIGADVTLHLHPERLDFGEIVSDSGRACRRRDFEHLEHAAFAGHDGGNARAPDAVA